MTQETLEVQGTVQPDGSLVLRGSMTIVDVEELLGIHFGERLQYVNGSAVVHDALHGRAYIPECVRVDLVFTPVEKRIVDGNCDVTALREFMCIGEVPGAFKAGRNLLARLRASG